MDRETIIQLARDAKVKPLLYDGKWAVENLDVFAALVAAHEREQCAKVCEEIEMQGHALWDRTADPDAQGRATGAMDCAAAIRSRK